MTNTKTQAFRPVSEHLRNSTFFCALRIMKTFNLLYAKICVKYHLDIAMATIEQLSQITLSDGISKRIQRCTIICSKVANKKLLWKMPVMTVIEISLEFIALLRHNYVNFSQLFQNGHNVKICLEIQKYIFRGELKQSDRNMPRIIEMQCKTNQ